jgi:quinoprotein glucose dehydrogenase
VLWTGDLPRSPEGMPAMYSVNGRQYLVVCASTALSWGRDSRESGPSVPGTDDAGGPGAYVAFALPERAAAPSARAR